MMPQISPAGHQIQVVTGDPEAIKDRGQQISDLATDMQRSSALLQRLVDNGADMRGDAIDKLKELSEKVHSDLKKGGDLYSAVAPYIKTYGQELDDSQKAMTTIIEDLCDLWDEYNRKADAADSARNERPDYPTGDDADNEQLRQDAEDARDEAAGAASTLANSAKSAWDARAKDYDTEWDSWHTAFTNAASGIRDDMAGKIEDSWSDDFGGFLQFMSDVLAVAGIILAVLAIVIGGPIIAILAGIVAVLTLAVALTRAIRGEGSWVDVAFGVIGVIPFIGPAARGLRSFAAADNALGFFGRMRPSSGWATWATKTNPVTGFSDFSARLFAGHSLDDFGRLTDGTATGLQTLEMVGNIWSSQFAIAGAIKDSAGGAWSGTFDPDQNPFS
ncbi:DUF308 domain-containing protein [Streptomyces sp. AC495_CC817]|uniref:DUF308 domain-containing protein n=1 Tax=Streptomyces sp. AC495_CC817 TaxID=2823900 RepID=UPI001C257EB5|nr:DUF308 domain-containing protein [Streptomyces sp. AC495_CC817]